MVEKSYFYIGSTNGKSRLHVMMWCPDQQVKAILQIAHGMAETIDRYDRFATFMAENGILVIGNDHLGHGHTAASMEELGYFDTKDRSATVVEDLYKVTTTVRAQNPKVPLILMGHSMGSFLARRYLMTYGSRIDGAIIMGTGSQAPAVLKAAKGAAAAVGMVKGERYRSSMIQQMAFGAYNKRIPNARTENDWLTRDERIVDLYQEDPYCGYTFTVNGFKTLFDVIGYIQEPGNIAKLPKNLPVLFVSGEEDPVGDYGRAVTSVYETYKAAGLKNIGIKLYPGDRHELLNELDYEKVQEDLLAFVMQVIGGEQK